jgi:uncharacterized protein YecE (DUF72 family)
VDRESRRNKKTDKDSAYIYFNNHYGGKAVVNALQFKALVGDSLSETETNELEHARTCLSNFGLT